MATEKENLFWTIVSHSIFNRMPYKSSNIADLSCSSLEFFTFSTQDFFTLERESVQRKKKKRNIVKFKFVGKMERYS